MSDAGKLDPRLRFLAEHAAGERVVAMESLRLAAPAGATGRRAAAVNVVLRCRKGPGTKSARTVEKKLADLNVTVDAVVDGPAIVVSGSVPVNALDALAGEDWVEVVDASKQLFLELDRSAADVALRPLHTVSPTVRGTGVLVGVIDGGIDYRHDDFRLADGTSRIRFLWDQLAATAPGGRVPYGREYTKAELDAALRTNPPPVPVAHDDAGGHGTHVAGIAAGNGRKSGGQFVGMAPDAGLVVVALRGSGGTLGESTTAVAACRYVVDRARELDRPVAINMSLGNNGGGHSGESPLETAMDNLAREAGVVLVKSAGNEQTWRIHASGTVGQGGTATRQFVSSGANAQDDVLEIWFDAADRIAIAVQAPGAAAPVATDFVLPGAANTFATASGNQVRVDAVTVDAGGTGDVRAVVMIRRGTASRIQPGRWALHLRGDQVTTGRFDAWIERVNRANGGLEQTRFTDADNDPAGTISIPGTARRIVTVGSYVTRFDDDAAVGELSRFSSRGPTRYGLRKPEIAAPGEAIVSALSSASADPAFVAGYTLMPGTSMAAPHVTGVAALLLEVNPRLTCEQVKQLLVRAARRNGAAAAAPDDAWGGGRLTADRAVDLARAARFPVVSNVRVVGTTIEWATDLPSTGAVRFAARHRRIALGRADGSRATLAAGVQHAIDLQGLPPGTYFCEILAFGTTSEQWETVDDNQGQNYRVDVP